MNFTEFLKQNIVLLDGGMGTLLQAEGLKPGEYPERWNLTHPEVIRRLHQAYFDAGSHVVNTNTFGANGLKFPHEELEAIITAAVENARAAAAASSAPQPKFVALDIGPSGKLLAPYGSLDFEEAVSLFAEVVQIGVRCGADLITIETMNDSYETKAALLAAKENSTLPVIVTNAYGADGKLMTGASPEAMAALLEGMGADAIGANCSLGPEQLIPVIERLLAVSSVPVVLKPNAGLPRTENGVTVYDVLPNQFADAILPLAQKGLRIAGGCCGTTPDYIKALADRLKGIQPQPIQPKGETVVSSYTHAVKFEDGPVLIGERINPTGKKRLKAALLEGEWEYILQEGLSQQEKGAHLLDVNVGVPNIDEPAVLTEAVMRLQEVCDLPLQLDTASAAAMKAALRRYNGKAMINSVSGKEESMAAIFPLVKQYGGVVVALTLDENGIPATVEGRLAIARRILQRAEAYGIAKKDIVFDALTMAVSADPNAAKITLETLSRIRTELGCHTVLGVSNVSFGLPNRDAVNGTFFALALQKGLSAAILNPHSAEMQKAYYAYRALTGQDENFADYLRMADSFAAVTAAAALPQTEQKAASPLQEAIQKGLRQKAAEETARLLQQQEPMAIVQGEIIPALDAVGQGFESGRLFLPQLLMSAEAAKCAFAPIKAAMQAAGAAPEKGTFVLATVAGDIHDIGKNIVRLLLENYGFAVIDLGKDVPAREIADAVIAHHAPLAGLSALMTTTVPAMAETVALLKEEAPWCRVLVGGAVMTEDYARKIGADAYAKDAMEAVRIAGRMVSN